LRRGLSERLSRREWAAAGEGVGTGRTFAGRKGKKTVVHTHPYVMYLYLGVSYKVLSVSVSCRSGGVE
jgi:hypothetical protein